MRHFDQPPQPQKDTSVLSWSVRRARGWTAFNLGVVLVALVTAALAMVGRWTEQDPPLKTYVSPDLFFQVEAPADWTVSKADGSNEVTFVKDDVSVSIAAADMEETDTVAAFLEVNKSKLREQCSAASRRRRKDHSRRPGRGFFHNVLPGPSPADHGADLGIDGIQKALHLQPYIAGGGVAGRATGNRSDGGELSPGRRIARGREPGKRARPAH